MANRSSAAASAGVLALLAAIAASPARAQTTIHPGELAAGDATLEGGEYVDDYTVEAGAGQEIVAIVAAAAFDPYLLVVSPSGETTESDDWGGSEDVSLVEVPAEGAGRWTVRVSSYDAGETGPYVLLVGLRPDDGEGPGRVFAWEVHAPLPAGPKAAVTGALSEDDARRSDGSFYDGWGLAATAGQTVVITLTAPDFDAYLTAVSPSGVEHSDDDSGGGTNAKLELVIDESGSWIVAANSLSADEVGPYELTVETRAAALPE